MEDGILKRGVVAGLVGATVVVLWFLVVDLLRGEPLTTPIFVASALLGDSAAAALPAYTVLHYMSFVIVGAMTSWVMFRLGIGAPNLIGLALGFLLFDLLFYGSVMATGADIVRALGWPQVLIGNLVAGLSVTHTVYRMEATGRTTWLTRAFEGRIVREGVSVGLAGAAAVALWYLVLDAMTGAALQTPSVLGGLLFAGETGAAAMPVNTGWVVGYTVVHVALFTLLGIALTVVAAAAEETPPLLLAALLVFVSFEALAMGMVALLSEFLPHAWWTVAGANLLAALAMGAILWARHPTLVSALSKSDELVGAD